MRRGGRGGGESGVLWCILYRSNRCGWGWLAARGGIRRVGRWYFFALLTHYDSSDGEAGQGNGWMDEARVGLAVSECIRRGNHDGMDIGSVVSGGAGTRWGSWLSYGTWYLGNFRTPSQAITRDNYTKVPKQNKHPFPLPVTFFSPGHLQIIAMHVWPCTIREEREKEKRRMKKTPVYQKLPSLSTSPAQSSPHQLPQIVPPLLQQPCALPRLRQSDNVLALHKRLHGESRSMLCTRISNHLADTLHKIHLVVLAVDGRLESHHASRGGRRCGGGGVVGGRCSFRVGVRAAVVVVFPHGLRKGVPQRAGVYPDEFSSAWGMVLEEEADVASLVDAGGSKG